MAVETIEKVEAFEGAWSEIIENGGAGDPYGRGFERAMRIALGEPAATDLIARVAERFLTGPEQK